MINDDPPGLGLKEQIDPAMENLSVLVGELHRVLDLNRPGFSGD